MPVYPVLVVLLAIIQLLVGDVSSVLLVSIAHKVPLHAHLALPIHSLLLDPQFALHLPFHVLADITIRGTLVKCVPPCLLVYRVQHHVLLAPLANILLQDLLLAHFQRMLFVQLVLILDLM